MFILREMTLILMRLCKITLLVFFFSFIIGIHYFKFF